MKVISTPKSSGSGSGAGGAGIDLTKEIMDATAEYEKVWQEAFDKMQNTAMGWADKVSKVFKPVKDIIEDLHMHLSLILMPGLRLPEWIRPNW